MILKNLSSSLGQAILGDHGLPPELCDIAPKLKEILEKEQPIVVTA